MDEQEKTALMKCALGRIFLLGSRPTRPGDVATYEACRRAILDAAEGLRTDHRPNYVRDRRAGAQGD